MSVWAIVVAGGRGERFGVGDADPGPRRKQFVELAGAPVVRWSTRTAAEACDGVVLVVPGDVVADPETTPAAFGVDRIVAGGPTRADSVRAGLDAVPVDADVVVVHDAARPLATCELFTRVVRAVLDGADAAVPAVPVTDTVKRVEHERVVETVERDDLVVVQTPQAFRVATLRSAHDGTPNASDDAALVERAGGTVVVVRGDVENLKITTPFDLVVAAAILDARDGAPR